MPDDLRPSEVARRLGTSTRTVQRWIETGRLPATRVGGRWRVASDAFDAFMPVHERRASSGDRATVRPIRILFVANRGEIANRIRRTCEQRGTRCIVPTTEGPDALDLLDSDAVVRAAVASGADAVHPGFGFLAENEGFARRVIDAGLIWVGPPPEAILAMGDKASARRLAGDLGIDVPSGYDAADQSDAALVAAGARIGTPLLVKPAAGGGGKGMRTVRDLDDLPAELAAARREARSSFGDDRLILERLIEGARHVEIQVLFDAHGHGVHLGERDCSVQRRHQKILEESPSPAVQPGIRERMGSAAVSLARAVDYVGAGTCEFLLDDDGRATFLEMNTRLQVEHPVTELVAGRDLVDDQLRIAAGEPLGFDQDDVRLVGHAVEVRLYAEDADAGFLPATGRIERLRLPTGEGVRVDAGVEEGDTVTARFDPMLAKIIAHGPDRPAALRRLALALDDTLVLGLTTNLRFLRWLVRTPAVTSGDARTDTLGRIWPPSSGGGAEEGVGTATTVPDDAWSTAGWLLVDGTDRDHDPWQGGFRINAARSLRLETMDETRVVEPRGVEGVAAVRVGDTVHVDVDGRSVAISFAPPPDVDRAASAAAHHGGGTARLLAPMPGAVLAVGAAVGSEVRTGDAVVTLEAMKLEHAVPSPIDGRVMEILVAAGDQVVRGQPLAVIGVG